MSGKDSTAMSPHGKERTLLPLRKNKLKSLCMFSASSWVTWNLKGEHDYSLNYFGTEGGGTPCLLSQVPSGILDKALSHSISWEVMGIRVIFGHFCIYKVPESIAQVLFKKYLLEMKASLEINLFCRCPSDASGCTPVAIETFYLKWRNGKKSYIKTESWWALFR